MFYTDLKDKRAAVFKRLTGVRPPTFAAMCRVLTEQWPSGGRKPTLAVRTGC